MVRSTKTVLPHVEAAVKQIIDGRDDPLLEQITEIALVLTKESLAKRASRSAADQLVPADDADIPLVVAMMNQAYRQGGTKSNWTTEVDYIEGDRTTEDLLREEWLAKPDGVLLTWRDIPGGDLKGSVWLEPLHGDTWYLGSLTVDPQRHSAGLGRTLLYCAEQWIQQRGGRCVQLTVVNVREPLIAWYVRRGYLDTGRKNAFPYGDGRFGTPLRDDLCFVVLEKELV